LQFDIVKRPEKQMDLTLKVENMRKRHLERTLYIDRAT
jgi:hypothetical protein